MMNSAFWLLFLLPRHTHWHCRGQDVLSSDGNGQQLASCGVVISSPFEQGFGVLQYTADWLCVLVILRCQLQPVCQL
jgi:hypothetical protein